MARNNLPRFKSLWKKESTDKNALYVDISVDPEDFPLETFYEFGHDTEPSTKNNELSLQFRNEGNSAFSGKNWHLAIDLYNKSLCFAENGSENIGLAFGNRSACFFNLKMFNKCLIDIDMALKSNYPDRLVEKLETRRNNGLKLIEDGLEFVPNVPVLTFEPKMMFPSMGNILQIEKNKKFGRLIKTNADVAVGETVLVEKAYVNKVIIDKYIRCNICYRLETNLVPCKDCTDDMFCYQECEWNSFHKIECNMKTMGKVDQISMFHLQIIRSVLMAIKTIPNIEQLMIFVEKTIAEDPLEIPESEPDDDLSKYRMFLKLWINSRIETNLFIWRVFFIYKTLMDNSDFQALFTSLKHQRFLMHLIGHHSGIIHYNARASIQVLGTTYATELQPLIAAYFNHSCAPNIATVRCDNVIAAIAIRPIRKGEQLFISYFGRDLNRDTAGRRRHFDEFFDFVCYCERCRSTVPFVQFVNTYNLEWIQYVLINYYNKKFDFSNESNVKHVTDKCAEYSRENGRNLWTDEVTLVMDCFVHMLEHKFKYKLTL